MMTDDGGDEHEHEHEHEHGLTSLFGVQFSKVNGFIEI
uniref:Uncharacterized protein n=1 Tax=Tetranychus urticae TaxID=32264 RepID=T1KXU6_TETUR